MYVSKILYMYLYNDINGTNNCEFSDQFSGICFTKESNLYAKFKNLLWNDPYCTCQSIKIMYF